MRPGVRRPARRATIVGASAATLLVVIASPAGPRSVARAAPAAASPASFTIRLDARGSGSFTARGGVVDSGRASVRRTLAKARLIVTTTLIGGKGRLVLGSRQPCSARTGTWRVVSGTGAYATLTGQGTTSRASCARPFRATVVVLRGVVALPSAVLVPPGSYGGSTAQDAALLFDVAADGRSLADVLLGGFRYDCVRSDGLRLQGTSGVDSTFAGPFPIADDRTFSFKAGAMSIAGRFTGTGAQGTVGIDVTYPADPQGRTTKCSGSTTWTAGSPPPPPKRALAGTYCGFILGGGGVCVEVASDGRQARNVRAESKLTCGIVAKIPVTVTLTSDLTMPLRTDLSFRGSFTVPFEGATVRAGIAGTFDQSGGLTGTVGPSQVTISRDGAQLVCRGNANFTARLQR